MFILLTKKALSRRDEATAPRNNIMFMGTSVDVGKRKSRKVKIITDMIEPAPSQPARSGLLVGGGSGPIARAA